MRGEDACGLYAVMGVSGSPPHARGRLQSHSCQTFVFRITPACAGKTPRRVAPMLWITDHPRMRGEDNCCSFRNKGASGSPPHARGRPKARSRVVRGTRITPACAGKTTMFTNIMADRKDHPRMRGEDLLLNIALTQPLGSPPHARGRQQISAASKPPTRITPACAGKTPMFRLNRRWKTDHPRMRGEDCGTPSGGSLRTRITPACAGKTPK